MPMQQRSPIVSPETLHARLDAPDLRIVDVRWVTGLARRGPARLRGRSHPGRDLPRPRHRPRRRDRPGPASVARAGGPGRASRGRRDRRRGRRSWSMTTSVAGSPRGCGGCSTISATERVRVLDGGLPAWLAAGFPTTTAEPGPRPRGPPPPARPVDQRDRSSGVSSPGSAGSSCSMPAAGRATAARSSRSIPSPATSRPPGARRPTPTSGRIDGCSRRPSWPSGSMRSVSPPRARS